MTLSDLSIHRPVFAWMLMAGLIVFGAISFDRLGVSQLPDVDFPTLSVNASLPGAAPEVVELAVVDPIEDAVLTVPGVRGLSSSARNGSASIHLEFGLEKDIDVAVQEVQAALAQVQRRLPRDVEPLTVRKSGTEDQPILWLAVSSTRFDERELMTFVRDHVRDRFASIDGVSEVFMGGYVEPNLRVWLGVDRLRAYQLTASDVMAAIEQEHLELPAGRLEERSREYGLRLLGEASSLDEFRNLAISRRGGSPSFTPIRLGQVARVEDGLADVRRRSRVDGKPAVGLGIRKQAGVNAVQVAQAVKARMGEVAAQLPEGTEIGVRFDTTRFIEEAVHELNFTLLLSALLTALVCWLFLGSWSATLNVLLAIPTSVIGAFIALYALGFTLNTFTLLGLSLAIGIVVDDAIMVLENIVRHVEGGKNRREAALVGAREVTFSALAATVAIIAIFLPVAFMEGIIGRFFLQFGVTISVAVALSLLEALTLTPMRCSQFLTVGPRRTRVGRAVDSAFDTLARGYAAVLPRLLDRRGWVIAGGIVFFAASLALIPRIPREFVPSQDQDALMLRVQAPVGASLEFTDGKVREVETYLKGRPELAQYYAGVGGWGGEVNNGMFFLTLKPKAARPRDPATGRPLTHLQIADTYRKDLRSIKDLRTFVQEPSSGAFGSRRGYPIELSLRGPDWEKLISLSRDLMKEMEKTGLMADVDSDYREGLPEIRVLPDREKAFARGVSVQEIAQTLNMMTAGAVAGQYAKGGRRYDVRVQLASVERDEESDLRRLFVRNNRGELVQLTEVVTFKRATALQTISRQDRERAITVSANIAKGAAQAEAIEATRKLAAATLPPGYRLVTTGSAKGFADSFKSLVFALVLGLLVSYMVLASQFNSFIHPFTVLVALPFSVSGALGALWLGGHTLNVYSMIGLVLLMGIVKKNSILLVDFTNQARERENKPTREALLAACPQRLRPILMTSLATIAGALPATLALGPGAESRIPMAVAVLGGVAVSTLLTLLIVPCVYSVLAWERKTAA